MVWFLRAFRLRDGSSSFRSSRATLVGRLAKSAFFLIKFTVIAVLVVEVLSFAAITATNLVLYGSVREGYGAVYDPYTLFLVSDNVWLGRNDGRDPIVHESSAGATENRHTIWIFGGSTLRGFREWQEKTIAQFVADRLNSSGGRNSFTVVNFGVPSFNSLMEVKYLQKALIERNDKPDLIIFYDGANEAKYFAEHRTPDAHHGYRRTKALIESYSRTWFGVLKPLNAALHASFTKELYDKLNQVLVPIDPDSPMVREFVDAAVRRYEYVHRLARSLGAEFLLVWQPMLWVEHCDRCPEREAEDRALTRTVGDFESVRNNFASPYHALMNALHDKPYFVDFRDALCDREAPMYTTDGVHLSDHGNRHVAAKLAAIVDRVCFKPALHAGLRERK